MVKSYRRLSRDELRQLFEMGLIGSGQIFKVNSTCDGQEVFDYQKCYFEYQCTVHCDSSD